MSVENAKLFIERSIKLENSPFWAWLTKASRQPSNKLIKSSSFIIHDDLREEDLDSFCLNLRFVIQDRDGLSIRKMKDFSSGFERKYSHYASCIEEATDVLNFELNRKSTIQLDKPKITTYEDVFKIIFYGGLVHANIEKRHDFDLLKGVGLSSYFVFMDFEKAILHYRNCYMTIAYNLHHYLVDIGEA